eukprot:6196586-Pleurochrysis_carterae.AAC.4
MPGRMCSRAYRNTASACNRCPLRRRAPASRSAIRAAGSHRWGNSCARTSTTFLPSQRRFANELNVNLYGCTWRKPRSSSYQLSRSAAAMLHERAGSSDAALY